MMPMEKGRLRILMVELTLESGSMANPTVKEAMNSMMAQIEFLSEK